MIAFYVFTAVVGIGLLALGALGGEGSADELELPDVGDAGSAGADASWKKAFSFRSLSYFMAGFGATGALLTLIDTAPTLTFLLAGGMGGCAAGVALVLFGWLRATEGGFSASSDAYIGATGRVRVPIRASAPGSIDIDHDGRVVTLRARALPGTDSDPGAWTDIIVVDVDREQGIVLVQPIDQFLADAGGSSSGTLHP